ncbi:MAG: DUF4056 domain-containing protein [Sedimentisphaerales bacterium]|nr:DUF4056 domain-containing protein [Sedimentisphaerales bacterium]
MKKRFDLATQRMLLMAVLCLCITVLGACGHKPGFRGVGKARKPPRIRMSCYASSTVGTTYADPERLGPHSYRKSNEEKNGIIYTCKGGHIDIAHLRKGADWTAFLAERTLEQLKNHKAKFSFKLYEPSRYFVQVRYPENWRVLPENEREEISREVSIKLGQYFSFIGCTWHEILTWFGYRPFVLYPEFASSFSWEDTYSNLLGTHIAGIALRDTEREYDDAVTVALLSEIESLGPQSRKVAMRASEQVRGKWFSGGFLFLINMRGRNLDIGLDDGFVTPWLVPSLDECPGAQPEDYPVPNLDCLGEYGFSVRLEIEPKEVEKRKILKIVYPDSKKRGKRIEPAVHFSTIMDRIERDAREKYGGDIGPPAADRRIESPPNTPGPVGDANMADSALVSKAGYKK